MCRWCSLFLRFSVVIFSAAESQVGTFGREIGSVHLSAADNTNSKEELHLELVLFPLSAPSCSPGMKNCISHRKVWHILTYNKVRRGDVYCSRENRIGPAFYRDSSPTARANSRENVKENEMDQIKYMASFSTWADHYANAELTTVKAGPFSKWQQELPFWWEMFITRGQFYYSVRMCRLCPQANFALPYTVYLNLSSKMDGCPSAEEWF